jgi:hypothetical protein
VVLAGPWPDTRAVVAPFFLFILPGWALLVALRLDLKSPVELRNPVELIASSFVISVFLMLILRVVLARLSTAIFSHALLDGIAIWTVSLLLVGYLWDTSRDSPRFIVLERWDMAAILLMVLLYAGMAVFVFNATYTPTPDELTYMLNARVFNLTGAIPLVGAGKVWLVNFVDARPLWFISLSSYLLVSAANSEFLSQVLSVFFFAMLVLATYRVGKRVLGGEVGLIAAVLLAVSPSVMIWGSTVLLDLPYALFLTLGYGFFIEAIQLRQGRLQGITFGSLVLAIIAFILSLLIKLADPILPALVYVYFIYLVWKSDIRGKRLVLDVLIVLPSIYLTFDALYNIFTYVIPITSIADLIRPFLPISFFERFFAFFYQGTSYKSGGTLTPLVVLQGIYLAGLAPFLITYPVLFMAIAGIITMIRSAKSDLSKNHAVFSIVVIGVASLLAALFLFSYEIARNVLYIYPFIIIAAAAGFSFSLQKGLKEFILSATGVVVFIYLVESSMLAIGISLGAIPAPSQYTLSLLSLNFLLGVGILTWKVLESSGSADRPVQSTRKWKRLSSPDGLRLVAIAFVCLFSFSQFLVFAQTSPYRSTTNFGGLTAWLNSNVRTGDIIFTNGRETLTSLLNDTTLRALEQGSVRMFPPANSSATALQLIRSSAAAYFIVFKQAEYTDSDSYSPQQFFTEEQLSSTFTDAANYQVYTLSTQASSSLSVLKVSSINSKGAEISGYYTTLWQQGVLLDSCFSPCVFSLKNGETYQLGIASYNGEEFSHWQNDSSTGFETVNVPKTDSELSLTAVFVP